jgi:hypothetical protein
LAAFGLQVNVKKTEAFGLDTPAPTRRSAEAMQHKPTASLMALGMADIVDNTSNQICTPRIRLALTGSALTRKRTAQEPTVIGVYPAGARALRCPLCPSTRGFAAVYATNARTAHRTLVIHIRKVHDLDAQFAQHHECETCGCEWSRTHSAAHCAAALAGKSRGRSKRCTACPLFGPPVHECVPPDAAPTAAGKLAKQPAAKCARRFTAAPQYPFALGDKALVWCRTFRYLGRLIDSRGGSRADVSAKLTKGRAAQKLLHTFLRRTEIPPRRKAMLMQQYVWSRTLYSAETWELDTHDLRKLRALQSTALRSALGARPQVEDRPPTDAEVARRMAAASDDAPFGRAHRPMITLFRRERTKTILKRSGVSVIDNHVARAQLRFFDNVMGRDVRLPERAVAEAHATPVHVAGRERPPAATSRRRTLYERLGALLPPDKSTAPRDFRAPWVWTGVGIEPTA